MIRITLLRVLVMIFVRFCHLPPRAWEFVVFFSFFPKLSDNIMHEGKNNQMKMAEQMTKCKQENNWTNARSVAKAMYDITKKPCRGCTCDHPVTFQEAFQHCPRRKQRSSTRGAAAELPLRQHRRFCTVHALSDPLKTIKCMSTSTFRNYLHAYAQSIYTRSRRAPSCLG